jgi:CelD/BcsL family acetyltransferase involved in cellulose biosynthesis
MLAGKALDNDDLSGVEIVLGKNAIEELGPSWDQLFERSGWASFHLARPWLQQLAQTSLKENEQLAVICAFDEGKVVAAIALVVRQWLTIREARPLGSQVPGLPGCYLGVLADPRRIGSVERVARVCREKGVFDVLSMNEVSTDDSGTLELIENLAKCGGTVFKEKRSVCRRVRLETSYEKYLASQMSSKHRSTLRREEQRVMDAASGCVESYAGPEVTSSVIDRIASIQERSWLKERGAPILSNVFLRELLLAVAKAGMARVWIIRVGEEDGAFAFGVIAKRTLYYVYAAFRLEYRRLSIGKVLTGRVIRDACEEGMVMLDFGHSDFEYKRFWGNDHHLVDRYFIGMNGVGKVIAWGLFWKCWLAARKRRLRRVVRVARGRFGR